MFQSLKSFISLVLCTLFISVGSAPTLSASEATPPAEEQASSTAAPTALQIDDTFQSRSIFTVGTHVIHATCLGFFTLVCFIAGGAIKKGIHIRSGLEKDSLCFLIFIATLAFSALGGLFSAWIDQKFLHSSKHRILFRNACSSIVPLILTWGGRRLFFEKWKTFHEKGKIWSWPSALVGMGLFFFFSELLRYYRDHKTKMCSKAVTIGTSTLYGGVVGFLSVATVSTIYFMRYPDNPIAFCFAVGVFGILLGLIVGLVLGLIHKFGLSKTKHPLIWRNSLLGLLGSVIGLILVFMENDFKWKKVEPIIGIPITFVAAVVVYILIIEGMRCYYDKLLATAKNSEEVSTPKEVSPEKVKAA